jgi:two-component system chemotaxis response regulator CheY
MTKLNTPVSDNDRSLRILIVDDSAAARHITRAVLSAASHHCAEAADGGEALTLILRDKFDVVVTDLEMPETDGFELIRAIVTLPAGADRPKIIVHSGRLDDPRVLARPELRNAHALIHKPATPGTLLGAIEAIINPDHTLIRFASGS